MPRTYLLDSNVFVYLRRAGRLDALRALVRLHEVDLASTEHVRIEIERDAGWPDIERAIAETPVTIIDFGSESAEGRSYERRRARRAVPGKNRGEDSCLAIVEHRPRCILVTHDERGAGKTREFGPGRGTDLFSLMIMCVDEGLLETEVARDIARDLATVSCIAPPRFWERLGPP